MIENRGGAAGTLGPGHMAANAKPDGYTVAQIPITVFRLPFMRKTTFDPTKDFTYIIGLTGYTFGVVVRKDAPWKTFQELLADAKANPGKINFGSGGAGTPAHVAVEQLKMMTGTDMVHVPYRGSAAAMTDLIGGRIQLNIFNADSALPHVRAGTVRALAVGSAARLQIMPDLPTVAETVPGYEASLVYGIGAPKGAPTEIIDKLNKEINAGLADPKIKARLATAEGLALTGSAADFGKLLTEETEKWAKVVKFAKLKPK